MMIKSNLLITGASTGICETYADRFGRPVMNARRWRGGKARMDVAASRLSQDTGVMIEGLPASLTRFEGLSVVEARPRDADHIGVKAGIPHAQCDMTTLYGGGAEGCTDDPASTASADA